MSSKRDKFKSTVERVVDNQNCTGCGACVLISDRVVLGLSEDGYLRPKISPGKSLRGEVRGFNNVCPGVSVDSRGATAPHSHPTFGRYWSVWEAWAVDDRVRYQGSSAGVTTALVQQVVTAGGSAVGAAASPERPSITVPVRLTTKEEALAAAGSRYAPVGNAALADGLRVNDAFVGKPCEIAAVRALRNVREEESGPLLLTFFCAGTPSQIATETLANEHLGVHTDRIASLRYRGQGWPGHFTVVSSDGQSSALTYKDSWGRVLGKSLQWRCKICPDGTGQLADVAVGDYWESDEDGYPSFESGEGRSVVICRTERGHDMVVRAAQSGAIFLRPMDICRIEQVQPFQVDRRMTMAGRLIGTAAAGRAVPKFRGFGILGLGLRHPERNLRAGVGAFLRVLGRRR